MGCPALTPKAETPLNVGQHCQLSDIHAEEETKAGILMNTKTREI